MAYVTITYSQRDAAMLACRFAALLAHLKEVPTKKYLWAVQGLLSRSFEHPNDMYYNIIQLLFKGQPVWIKYALKAVEQGELQSDVPKLHDRLAEISFGYLESNTSYSRSEGMENNRQLIWETNIHAKYLAIKCETSELRLTHDCLEKYFIISTAYVGIYTIILPLKAPPRCYVMSRGRGQPYERAFTFGMVSAACLANSTAVCLRFQNDNLLTACIKFLSEVMNLDGHNGSINCVQMPSQTWHCDHVLSDFWSNYAYQMLISLGYRVKCQITAQILVKIMKLSYLSNGQPYSSHSCYQKLIALYYRARHNHFFDIQEVFDNTQPIAASVVLDKWKYVPRVYLTPYGVYPLPIKPMRGNRILREQDLFGPDEHFCRVIIRDVDLGQPQSDFMKVLKDWIKKLLIGNDYSTARQKFWFHAVYQGRGVKDIRKWMGDFSHERCVGTRIARMALSLTGTTPTIRLLSHQLERIPDKVDLRKRKFTDGVGKISPMALREALLKYNPELIQDDYMPCVIQARLNGIKGIFVLAPDLEDRGILIQYRDSQYKFETSHNVLEIVKHASSGMAFLNRQVIVLLENMGVPKHIFLRLQNKAAKRIALSLLANKPAQQTLEQHVRCYDWERMRKSGIRLTKEPFARSLLRMLALDRLRRLKERSHVSISLSDGRMLLGVVDETNSLQYGQVFIQLRDLNGERHIVQNRKILITKNPAHFPGDSRKLDAVDCPALHHLSECVVFPAEGQRPHPNEISGSDLDGDEYWVCWNDDLVNSATKQHEPADFDSARKKKHVGEITMDVIAGFLFRYLSSDSLGALSNRHLACCALHKPNHEYSLRLAEVISQAVDFPKTGVLPNIPRDIKIDQYPDFMENKYKESFICKSSIGTMYRQVKEVWKMHSTSQDQMEEVTISPDQNLLKQGYKRFIAEAEVDYQHYTSRINSIVSIYNLPNEYELITGCHSGAEEEKKNNDSVETASLEFRHLVQEMRNRFGQNYLSYGEQLCKASAWYYVAYKAGVILSFGWIMNRLMSDIMKEKQILQEEHLALKQIGTAICRRGFDMTIRNAALVYNLKTDASESYSDVEKLGWQFLEIIDKCSETPNEQEYANKFLLFLHKVALNLI